MTKKITKATFKSFLKNAQIENLFINVKSSFDGMTDSCEQRNGGFKPAQKTDSHIEYTLGFNGIWIVGGGRDYFQVFESNGFKGFEVFNACGSFIVAQKQVSTC